MFYLKKLHILSQLVGFFRKLHRLHFVHDKVGTGRNMKKSLDFFPFWKIVKYMQFWPCGVFYTLGHKLTVLQLQDYQIVIQHCLIKCTWILPAVRVGETPWKQLTKCHQNSQNNAEEMRPIVRPWQNPGKHQESDPTARLEDCFCRVFYLISAKTFPFQRNSWRSQLLQRIFQWTKLLNTLN